VPARFAWQLALAVWPAVAKQCWRGWPNRAAVALCWRGRTWRRRCLGHDQNLQRREKRPSPQMYTARGLVQRIPWAHTTREFFQILIINTSEIHQISPTLGFSPTPALVKTPIKPQRLGKTPISNPPNFFASIPC
jgi:hypothetical protein